MRFRKKNFVHPKYGECQGPDRYAMPKMFSELARYNARVAQGIVHTDEYKARMKALQTEFRLWRKDSGGGP